MRAPPLQKERWPAQRRGARWRSAATTQACRSSSSSSCGRKEANGAAGTAVLGGGLAGAAGCGWVLRVRRGLQLSLAEAAQVATLLAACSAAQMGEEEEDKERGEAADGALQRRWRPAPQLFQLRLLAALLWRAAVGGDAHVAVLAYPPRGSGELAGVATVCWGFDVVEGAAAALAQQQQQQQPHSRGAPCAATVANMAVAARHRRRGLGRLLLRACEGAAEEWHPPPQTVALVVYRLNAAAAR